MRVNYKMFKSYVKSWQTLFDEASEFATRLGSDKLINISHACDQNVATVTVWYWGKH